MPSAEHESPVALAKLDPSLVAWLLTHVFNVKVPDYHHARTHATDVRVLVPRTYHADGMLLFCDPADRPLLAAVFEIQRRWDATKRRTWKLYVAQLETELDVDAALLVYCPDPRTARRYRGLFEFDGLSLSLRPFIFTPNDVPLVVDVDLARTNPALAVLSAICHGQNAQVEATFPALMEALRSVGPRAAILYYDVVLAGLPAAVRTRWEAFMTTTADYELRSELLRELAARYEKQGEARGEARAILTVLDGRGVAVPAEAREQILACTDLPQLDTWLRRAGNATSVDDVLGG
ncbi:hypothetical protein [Plantactinospora endophytica]|uniref:Rpn family recombination-promoting nuclease/putative transposase n=1 Tax=Plantactinospora endophytica TaxID=673535 RepID=A0ABQ4DV62_9ACTN|nr:hypothetical protein [Plantactinospora endophytica]GIG86351.1 hypothetical protein Pen02_12870 [Plantactinospora endophytica]